MFRLTLCLSGCVFLALEASSAAERLQLPCDGDLSLSLGGDIASTKTDTGQYGVVGLSRSSPMGLGLEVKLFDACTSRPSGSTSRWWLGRLSFSGGLAAERSSLTLDRTLAPVLSPQGKPVLDSTGQPEVEDGLARADLAGQNGVWSAGTRLALVDVPYFHLDVHAGASGSLGWAKSTTEKATAHALNAYREIGWYLADNLDIEHRWRMLDAGVTLASPIPVSGGIRITPEITVGYARLDAWAKVGLSEQMLTLLAYAHVDPATLKTRFSMRKDTPIAHLGLRADVTERFSLDLAALRTPSGTYWMAASATIRFDAWWKT